MEGQYEFPDNVLKKLEYLRKVVIGKEKFMPGQLSKYFQVLNYVDDQLRAFCSAEEIIEALEIKFDRKVSKATAYRWIQQAKFLFKTIDPLEKDYDKRVLNEMLKKQIKAADSKGDYLAVDRLIRTYWKANKLDELTEFDEGSEKNIYQLIINNANGSDLVVDIDEIYKLNSNFKNELVQKARLNLLPPSLNDIIKQDGKEGSEAE